MKAMILISFLAAGQVCLAQFVPVRTSMATPYGNVNYTSHQYTGVPYNQRLGIVSYRYEFYIMLKEGKAISAKTFINTKPDSLHSVTVEQDKISRTIYPSETKSLSRITSVGKQILGIPADSCWLFKIKEGKINAYSFLAQDEMTYVIAIQIEDGAILPLTKANLMPMVATNKKATRMVEKNKLKKAIVYYNSTDAKLKDPK